MLSSVLVGFIPTEAQFSAWLARLYEPAAVQFDQRVVYLPIRQFAGGAGWNEGVPTEWRERALPILACYSLALARVPSSQEWRFRAYMMQEVGASWRAGETIQEGTVRCSAVRIVVPAGWPDPFDE